VENHMLLNIKIEYVKLKNVVDLKNFCLEGRCKTKMIKCKQMKKCLAIRRKKFNKCFKWMQTKKTFTEICKAQKCCSYLKRCLGKKCATKKLKCGFKHKCQKLHLKKTTSKKCEQVQHFNEGENQCKSKTCCFTKKVCSSP